MAVSRLSQSTLQNAFPKYNSAWDGVSAVGSMEAISTVTLAASQSSITFSNIPQTYSHLQIRANFAINTSDNIQMRINGDSASNYSWHNLLGNGTAASASSATSTTFMVLGSNSIPSSGSQTNIFNGIVIDVLDYTNTNKYKTLRGLGGNDANGSGYISLNSGLWFKAGSGVTSDAITSIVIWPDTGSFNTYSSFTLYGIK